MSILILTLLLGSAVPAHENIQHGTPRAAAKGGYPAESVGEYNERIAPLFKRVCFDCHSGSTKYPWYWKLPFVKWLIENDIKDARSHLDMSNCLPFAGHGSAEDDLAEVREAVAEHSMPPLRYRIMHRKNQLTQAEVKAVVDWADRSLATMETGKNRKAE